MRREWECIHIQQNGPKEDLKMLISLQIKRCQTNVVVT